MASKDRCRRFFISTIVVVVSATASIGLTQMAEQIVDYDSFEAISALVWFSFSFLVLFYPAYFIISSIAPQCRHQTLKERCRKSLTFNGKLLTWRQFFLQCGLLSILLTSTLYLVLEPMKQLAPADVFAILSAHNCVQFLCSWVILHEQFLLHRFAAFLLGAIGMIHFVYIDGYTSPTISAVMYSGLATACFTLERVIKKRLFAVQYLDQSAMLISLCASLVLLVFWFLPVLLHVTGMETLHWELVPWSHVALFIPAVFLFIAITSLGPLLCAWQIPWIGMGVALPINSLIDSWFRNLDFPVIRIVAYAFLLASCLIYLLPANVWEYLANKKPTPTVEQTSLTRRYWNAGNP